MSHVDVHEHENDPNMYYSHCLNPGDGEWYMFNDARVSLSSAEAMSKLQAYILFCVFAYFGFLHKSQVCSALLVCPASV